MMLTHIINSERGFSFIELMSALLIIAIAIAALLSFLPVSLFAGRKATRMDMAVKLAQQRLEEIKTVAYSELNAEAESGSFTDDNGDPAGGEALATFKRDVEVTERDMDIGTEVGTISVEVTDVTVKVYYREKGSWKSVELIALFAQ